ncbi:hypothetical protein GCM10009603_28340 [Nocardiopsis exhalans]
MRASTAETAAQTVIRAEKGMGDVSCVGDATKPLLHTNPHNLDTHPDDLRRPGRESAQTRAGSAPTGPPRSRGPCPWAKERRPAPARRPSAG